MLLTAGGLVQWLFNSESLLLVVVAIIFFIPCSARERCAALTLR